MQTNMTRGFGFFPIQNMLNTLIEAFNKNIYPKYKNKQRPFLESLYFLNFGESFLPLTRRLDATLKAKYVLLIRYQSKYSYIIQEIQNK